MCHNSPEVTHFYLRDEEDQFLLADNAEARCISCHRDGEMQPDGRRVPALATEADIIAAVELGTLRAWSQPGGFMAKIEKSPVERQELLDRVLIFSTDNKRAGRLSPRSR